MKLIADTHLHIYPFYDVPRALDALLDNLNRHDSTAIKVGCLTERFDCDVYRQIREDATVLPRERFTVDATDKCLEIRRSADGASVILLPGQQIITAENLEVLMLNAETRLAEGESAEKTVEQILDAGGIPVVAWGFGKWLGPRGKVVSALVDKYDRHQLAIGDSTMRPGGWPTPGPYRQGAQKGMKLVCGSDPLPFSGEEIRPGSYATAITTTTDETSVSTLFQNLLSNDSIQCQPAGKRSSILTLATRMQGHRRKGKIAGRRL